jgi:hypothetical protein
VAIFHGPGSSAQPVYNLGTPFLLEKEMFCCCGFKTDSGNKLGTCRLFVFCFSPSPLDAGMIIMGTIFHTFCTIFR